MTSGDLVAQFASGVDVQLEGQQHTNTAVQTYNNAATGTYRVNIQLLRHTTSTSEKQDYINKAE
jgi:hypothetical protein